MLKPITLPKIPKVSQAALGTSLMDTPLRKYFEAAVQYEASDLLIHGGQKARIRLHGVLKTLDAPPLSTEDFEAAIDAFLSSAQRKIYTEQGSLDLGIDLDLGDEGVHRFRMNIFRTRGFTAIAARRLNSTIPGFQELHLPQALEQATQFQQGLVLVAGASGSGKSTTIASMLQHINENRACHILTIEDPIEYLFTSAKAVVSQREVGVDVPSFSVGLSALLRETPDVVLIGEMRSRETLEAALQAAETGHLVFGTIHAPSPSQVLSRIYDMFLVEERDMIRHTLAHQLQAMIYQKLLPTIRQDVQRVPVLEILLQSPAIRSCILDAREHQLSEVIQDECAAGMQTLTDNLVQRVNEEYIHPRVAAAAAANPIELMMRLKGIETR